MRYDRLVTGLAVVFGAITVTLTVVGVAYSPAVLFVALTFGLATYFVYYHASGRMAARVYRRVERQAAQGAGGPDARRTRRERRARRSDGGSFGAGPRDAWRPPRDGATAREAAGRARQAGFGRRRATQRGARQRRAAGGQRVAEPDGPTAREAYRTLGLDPGADADAVKAAYRAKVKEVHPDADGGDRERFRAVQDAYDRLTD